MGNSKTPSERTEKWTYGEYVRFIEKKVIEEHPEFEGFLDYSQATFDIRDTEIVNDDISIVATVDFGGSEGVYADFYKNSVRDERLAIAKTLEEGDDAFRKMSSFACEFKLVFDTYMRKNSDEFNYLGYQVGLKESDGTISWRVWSSSRQNAEECAKKRAEGTGKTYIVRENSSRKIVGEFSAKGVA